MRVMKKHDPNYRRLQITGDNLYPVGVCEPLTLTFPITYPCALDGRCERDEITLNQVVDPVINYEFGSG